MKSETSSRVLKWMEWLLTPQSPERSTGPCLGWVPRCPVGRAGARVGMWGMPVFWGCFWN